MRKIKEFLCIMLFFLVFPFVVYAKDGIYLDIDKTDLKAGDEVVVTASVLEDVKLYALTATLNYDASVFEKIDEEDFVLSNENVSITYSDTTNKFGILNKTGEISGELFQIHLTVKNDANVGDSNIVFTNITSSDGENKETYDKASKQVLVTRDAKEGEEIPNHQAFDANDKEESVVKTISTLPFSIGITVLIVLLILFIVWQVKTKKPNRKKKVMTALRAILALLLALLVLFFIGSKRKDINNDGETTYEDTQEIIKYLIEMEGTPSFKEEIKDQVAALPPSKTTSKKNKNKYDVNNDGKVDINDAGSSAEHVTEEVRYTVKLSAKENSYYFEKGSITLEFYATVSPKETIKEVKINGTYYPVEQVGEYYRVLLEETNSGVHTYKLSEVRLSNTREVHTNLSITKEVLKDIPYVNNFNVNETTNTFTFNLIDNDHAFKNGTATVYDGENEVAKVGVATTTYISTNLDADKIYNVMVIGNYDLDTNENNNANAYTSEEMFAHSFLIGGDYNFTLTNVLLSDTLEKDEKPKLTFTSTNTRATTVEEVTLIVDGIEKEYTVTKIDGDNYEVAFDAATTGKHTVKIKSIRLQTLKQFENDTDFHIPEMTYEVLKDAPKVSNINLQEHSQTETRKNDKNENVEVEVKGINATFKLEDNDNAVSNFTIALVDSTNKIVATKELSREEFSTTDYTKTPIFLPYADKNNSNNNYGYFTVQFLADYTLGDKYNYTDKNIGEQTFTPDTGVKITNIKFVKLVQRWYGIEAVEKEPNEKFATKGEKPYYLQFEVETEGINSYSRLSSVTINGLNYTLNGGATANADEGDKENTAKKYKYISYTAVTVPKEAGIVDVKANRVQFENNGYYIKQNDYYTVPEKTTQFEVLKDVPSIKNLEIKKEDKENKSVTFAFDVIAEDGVFKTGKVSLGKEAEEIITETGHNEVTFTNIEPNQEYDLIFKATYDLDSGEFDKEGLFNSKTDEPIYTTKYGMYDENTYKEIAIKNGKAISVDKDKYFEKTEPIRLQFTIDGIPENLGLEPQRVMIDRNSYDLTKVEDGYEIVLDGATAFGEKELTITNVFLNNGKNVTLNTPYTIRPVVLKDVIQLENYHYEINDNEIKVMFDTKDYDGSLVGKAKILVQDEDGNIVYNGMDHDGNNEITFKKIDNVLRYYITITGNYDRDVDVTVDSDNYHKNVSLLEEVISLEKNTIELKDIFDIRLYKIEENDKITLVDEVDVEMIKTQKQNYFVEVSMENLPSIHARIKNVVEENGQLILELEYECTINEGRTETKELKVVYGKITDKSAKNENHPDTAFKALLDELQANQEVTLTHDYDASALNVDSTTYVTGEFSGKLHGNGFTIKNLDKPLFDTIKNGVVEQLNIKNVTLNGTGFGTLANKTSGATIENVVIDYVAKTSASNHQNGGLIGLAKDKTRITNSGVKNLNFSVSGKQQTGGLVGCLENSSIDNSYAIGKITSGYNFIGGLVGNSVTGTITNSFAKVNVQGDISCDFACSYNNSLSSYENDISLGTGGNQGFVGGHKKLENSYHLMNTSVIKNQEGVTEITQEDVTTELFATKAHFDDAIWRLKENSYENTPILKTERITELYDIQSEDYDEEKVNLYNNLMKLMPYYDGERILEIAKNVTDTNLIHNEIVNLVPVDASGKLVTYLTSDNVKKIDRIKIIYKDKQKVEYKVLYDNTYDLVASYRIPALKLDYNYKNYILNADAQIVNNLTNYLLKLDYTNNLDTLTTTADSRLYRDFYNETTKKDLREFVLKFLSNSNYASTTNDTSINNYLEREVKEDKKIEKVLYLYNYFKRFYSLEIDGLDISDFMLFNLSDFDSSLTPLKIAELFLQDGNNFSTGNTNTKYISVLSNYTKLNNIADLLEYLVTGFSNHTMHEWISSQYKGYLVEIAVKEHPEVQYTLWDHLSTPDKGKNDTSYTVYNYILPILTLPKNAAYIISTPVQFIIGAQRSYIENPEDAYEQSILQRRIASYASRMEDYFDTAYKILQDATLFNSIHTYQVDKRFAYDSNGAMVYQQQLVTEEPFHKNFSEAVGRWNTSDGNAAVAYGDRIEWNAEGLMDGYIDKELADELGKPVQEYTYHTWSHESAHNIDARLFLRDNGRRFDAGGEDYADSNLMQSFGDGDIVMNLSVYFPTGSKISSNLTPTRIDSQNKVHDFYNKVFQTIYILDYLEGEALLKLSDEEKANLVVQASYPNDKKYDEDNLFYKNHLNTVYQTVDKDKIRDMNLQTVNDLTDNQLVIMKNVIYSTYTDNRYGGENIYKVHWYQPNNEFGRPDSYSLKWFAYEMLGYNGYNNGYIEYYSNINSIPKKVKCARVENGKCIEGTINYKDDLMALRKITGNPSITFNEYKHNRFNEVKQNLQYIQILDVNEVYNEFYQALKQDAAKVAEAVTKAWETYPNEDDKDQTNKRNQLISNARDFANSTEVRRKYYYMLKDSTNDFEEAVYNHSNPNNFQELTLIEKE